jgi:hypothetical protein
MISMLDRVGRLIAAYLQRPAPGYQPLTPADPAALRATIRPGDILLIEGRTHMAGMIKYLTQSTWSHAALYVGPMAGEKSASGEICDLVESNIEAGILAMPLSTYLAFHTRICRPVGLSAEDCKTVCDYAVERIGLQYDLKNFIDLARYMVPLPVPQRFRRRMIALGSGDPTKLICSALIAQAFGAIGYPILPAIERIESEQARREIYHIRDSSLYCPRDFDISPYFAVVKPTIEMGFDYKSINWSADR